MYTLLHIIFLTGCTYWLPREGLFLDSHTTLLPRAAPRFICTHQVTFLQTGGSLEINGKTPADFHMRKISITGYSFLLWHGHCYVTLARYACIYVCGHTLTDILLLPAIYAGLLFFPPVNPSSF